MPDTSILDGFADPLYGPHSVPPSGTKAVRRSPGIMSPTARVGSLRGKRYLASNVSGNGWRNRSTWLTVCCLTTRKSSYLSEVTLASWWRNLDSH
jgi:hypothetical protein